MPDAEYVAELEKRIQDAKYRSAKRTDPIDIALLRGEAVGLIVALQLFGKHPELEPGDV